MTRAAFYLQAKRHRRGREERRLIFPRLGFWEGLGLFTFGNMKPSLAILMAALIGYRITGDVSLLIGFLLMFVWLATVSFVYRSRSFRPGRDL